MNLFMRGELKFQTEEFRTGGFTYIEGLRPRHLTHSKWYNGRVISSVRVGSC